MRAAERLLLITTLMFGIHIYVYISVCVCMCMHVGMLGRMNYFGQVLTLFFHLREYLFKSCFEILIKTGFWFGLSFLINSFGQIKVLIFSFCLQNLNYIIWDQAFQKSDLNVYIVKGSKMITRKRGDMTLF